MNWTSLATNVDHVCHRLDPLPGRRYPGVCPVGCRTDNPVHHRHNPGVLHESPACHRYDRRYSAEHPAFARRECRPRPQALLALPIAVPFPSDGRQQRGIDRKTRVAGSVCKTGLANTENCDTTAKQCFHMFFHLTYLLVLTGCCKARFSKTVIFSRFRYRK